MSAPTDLPVLPTGIAQPLVFEEDADYGRLVARTPIGSYELSETEVGWTVLLRTARDAGRFISNTRGVSRQQAADMCQADYERLVVACLSPQALERLSACSALRESAESAESAESTRATAPFARRARP